MSYQTFNIQQPSALQPLPAASNELAALLLYNLLVRHPPAVFKS